MLSSDQLNNLIETTIDSRTRFIAKRLEMAINDWPTLNLCEPHQLINELNLNISDKLTFDNIRRYLDTLNPLKDSWKMESVLSIMEMFVTDETRVKENLEDIINRISGDLE